ncbi:NifU family protein [Spiroplasma taiwanense]|uniref:NifU-like domain-containing protein n=1 Tax=Spiroplasma taiwanense CT-1 TaxID=1276220 RepID=S5LUL1_9MOLU|nr:NifU family protein [Spiroplasma taiwanense]AGR41489.1 NifU-like domain-containing protein [Spiroplasma taiwanense CT-1]
MEKNNLEKEVKQVLEQLRMYVTQDGGDMEFVAIKNRLVYIRLKGNCVGCSMTELTFKEGIETVLLEEFPYELDGVELVM